MVHWLFHAREWGRNAGIADQVQISQFGFLCISEAILGYNLTEVSTMLSQYNTTVTDHTTLKNQVWFSIDIFHTTIPHRMFDYYFLVLAYKFQFNKNVGECILHSTRMRYIWKNQWGCTKGKLYTKEKYILRDILSLMQITIGYKNKKHERKRVTISGGAFTKRQDPTGYSVTTF